MDRLSFILFGHAAFQYLNAACELGLLDLLAERGPLSEEEVREQLGLQERACAVLLLGSTALGLTVKDGSGYRVADLVASLRADGTWQKIKDTVAFEQDIVYEGQADFAESLLRNTNVGLRRVPGDQPDLYQRLGGNPRLESVFYRYMKSWSELANTHLVHTLDLTHTRRLLDCGGGDAVNAIALARHNPGLEVTVLEIPASAGMTAASVERAGLSERVSVQPCDMFADPFPSGMDCVLFAHQLVIWTPEQNTALLRKAHAALAPGGRVVIFNSMSNDEGDGPLVAALDSVYFAALPAEGGMIYPWRVHERCLREAGFGAVERFPVPGWTPHGIIVATKEAP
ncbi:methyltransferase domain-containing protein [Streptomyces oryzae]|uniref:Methyltransferase domain-containing protein n=1 Tax=Streptomyces oryzae TaxID=1434886 RepID=A0ABS3X7X2_9ACTN|nr:methyltransferase [Streptomyces oryzae]MBO8191487.1 methyltransferase domain-containing protein [Streptomyces oryzae]